MRTWTRRRGDAGAATVEFAVVTVFVLIPLLITLVGYGYMLSFRQALSQAAAEGARAAAVAPPGTLASDREARALDAVDRAIGYGMTCSSPGVTCTAQPDASDCAAPASCWRVTVRYNYRDRPLTPTVPGLGWAFPDQIGYSASAEVS